MAVDLSHAAGFDLFDLEARAGVLLPAALFRAVADGGLHPITDARARRSFASLAVDARRLVNLRDMTTATTVLTTELAMPVAGAPLAIPDSEVHHEGTDACARGALAAGTVGITSHDGPWRGLAICEDREETLAEVHRAERTGAQALFLTLRPAVVPVQPFRRAPAHDGPGRGNERTPTMATPDDVAWLVSHTNLPVAAHGVLRADDAHACVQAGAAAVVAGHNRPGRVDGTISAIEALPEIVDAVGSEAEVLLHGNVRRGLDVLKAVAIGARAVLISRPVAWALATAGAAGVERMYARLQLELAAALAMSGRTRVDQLGRDALFVVPPHDVHEGDPRWVRPWPATQETSSAWRP